MTGPTESHAGVHPNLADSLKWPHGCAYCGGLHVPPTAPQADNPDLRAAPSGLDAAWQEAEAALPEGWTFEVGPGPKGYWANGIAPEIGGSHSMDYVTGATPAAALRALAARLAATPERTEP